MPGDSLKAGNGSIRRETYDAIIVGSGISGGWAAKELCEKGLKVLLLDRGAPVKHPDYPTATMDPWEFKRRLRLSREDKTKHPVQSRHWSFREDNKHFYINDLENPYDEIKRFDWIRGDIVGGRSLLWSRACYRWSDLDFEANLKEGIATDWPIRYRDIEPWYDYVESFIGVSGSKEGIPHLPDGIFQPPFEMNAVEKYLKGKIESRYPDRKLIMGRTANLTKPVQGRGQCQARDLCHRGCPYGAYFSANASTLPAAFATGNLTIRPMSLVNRVLYDGKKRLAAGVELIDTRTNQLMEFHSRIVFLNASTVATAFILLNSTSPDFPTGLGNESDQVGRNLMDHHKGLSANALVSGFEDSYYSGRRPTPAYIPRFRNLRGEEKNFLRGYHYGLSASRPRASGDGEPGAGLKESLCEPGGWQINLYGFGECLPYPDNRVTLNRDKKDQWGRPLISIDCAFKENENRMHEDMGITAKEMLTELGLSDIRISNPISFPGNANHEMGTARMGRDPKTSALNSFNQLHGVRNVFITDGSCMTSGSCVNPSLTYMALTARACAYAVGEMKKGNI